MEAGDDPSWRSFGHDAANTNYAPDGTAPTGGVAERWRLRGERLSAQAAIADGAVYAPVMTTVVAVDAESGDVLWSPDPDEDAGRGTVALDAAGGQRRWTLETGTGDTNPVVVGETVYTGGERLTATRLRGRVSVGPFRVGARRFAYRGSDGVLHVSGGEGLLVASVSADDGGSALVAFESA
ncbi:hypothetical protein DWB78_12725 [Halopelagius longus]|uniref:PQQ-like domain-containing protein n=1 Tax=Halopelagius longus TaxID=1236180 RepID=A0A370IPA8_9EURY|nr:hypothetical protein DWB78_12725 [Halopelagius longus]